MDVVAQDTSVVQEQDASGQWVDIPVDAPAETPEAQKPAASADAAPVDPKKGKPRHDPEARISQAVARQREAERRADDAEKRARDLEARTTPQPAAKSPAPAAKEKFTDFPTWVQTNPEGSLEDWMDARDEWRDTKREAAQKVETQTRSTEETFQTRVSTFGERFSKAATADPELVERLDRNLLGVRPLSALTAADKDAINKIADPRERNEVTFRCFLADQWIDSEHAVAILERLSDPAEFQRLAALPPNKVVWELASYVQGLPAASRGPAKKTEPITSKAPAPITPLRSTPHQSEDAEPDDNASDDEWLRFERARQARARGRR